MKNVQRLDVEYTSFYTDCVKIIQSKCASQHPETRKMIEDVCKKYEISVETLYYRIRSIFGKGIKELRFDFYEPSRELLLKTILISKSSEEVKQKLDIPAEQWKGIYDRVLGVSIFQQAKVIAMHELIHPQKYNPSTKDNDALIAACRLGDGSVERGQALRIEHCSKQRYWLETKVSILKKAFPFLQGEVKETKRSTYAWRSYKIEQSRILKVFSMNKEDLPALLTPFGLWVLYLDDGSYSSNTIDIAVENQKIGTNLIEILKTFGFNFKSYSEHTISIKDSVQIFSFLQTFAFPFEHLTPDCMKYKTMYKGIVHRKLA